MPTTQSWIVDPCLKQPKTKLVSDSLTTLDTHANDHVWPALCHHFQAIDRKTTQFTVMAAVFMHEMELPPPAGPSSQLPQPQQQSYHHRPASSDGSIGVAAAFQEGAVSQQPGFAVGGPNDALLVEQDNIAKGMIRNTMIPPSSRSPPPTDEQGVEAVVSSTTYFLSDKQISDYSDQVVVLLGKIGHGKTRLFNQLCMGRALRPPVAPGPFNPNAAHTITSAS